MYWVKLIGKGGSEVLLSQVSEIELTLLIPLLAELGIFSQFGLAGSTDIIGGSLGG